MVLFYEVDLRNERYATRMVEVFPDRSAKPVMEPSLGFVTEAPVPSVEEINEESGSDDVFFAEYIAKAEFEAAFESRTYAGPIDFPE